MDFNFIVNNIEVYVKAATLTLKISFFGILFSIIIGLILALILYYKIPLFRQVSKIYIEISRNTPLLIQLVFLYYGLPRILNITLDAEITAIIGLTFLGASYMCESFRSAIQEIKMIQIESALSLGFSEIQIIRYIILPLAFSISLPSFGANIIFLIKETSVVTIIALADLMYATSNIIGNYYKTSEALFLLVISYLIILLPISLLFSYLEKRFRYV
ncbi:MAG: amino acid ABC transporter permease [Helicobacteraceae bacterium]|nr:amino acid ABC transporter permease [Helicobacteraceae bacterium]